MSNKGPQQAFKHGRFGAVWSWAKGSLSRWKQALSWARRRKKKTPDQGFGKAAKAYLHKKQEWLKHHKDPKPAHGNFVTFDGHQVPRWIVKKALDPARKAGVSFTVISGYRSPAYSQSLCEAMCGAPSCPGRCAGTSSNHCCPPTFTGKQYEGAVDIEPGWAALRTWCEAHGNPIRGGGSVLPSDPQHFSRNGN